MLRGWHRFSSSNLPARGGTAVAGRRGRGVVAAGEVVPHRCAAEHGGEGPHGVRPYVGVWFAPVWSQEVSPLASGEIHGRPALPVRQEAEDGRRVLGRKREER